MTVSTAAIAELDRIRLKNGGILRPVDVVEYAKNPQTALHSAFEWDDTAAAHQYRLEQARHVIRCTVLPYDKLNGHVRAYVSLQEDRKAGDSYRSIDDVMADKVLRQQLLDQALREAESWRLRYERFAELAPIVKAISTVRKRKATPKRESKPERRRAVAV